MIPAPVCDLDIHALAFGGDGIGRLENGKVCFVRGVIPGERVRVSISRDTKSFCRGDLLEILSASPDRIVPECPFFGTCPGCSALHMTYDVELRWKHIQFAGFLTRGTDIEEDSLLPPFPAPRRTGYRNKLTFHCQDGSFCYLGLDNKSPVPVNDCLLARAGIREYLSRIPRPDSADAGKRIFRWTLQDGVLDSGTPEWAETPFLTEQLGSFGAFRVAPPSFFQVNIPVASELVSRAVEAVGDSQAKNLLELFCGTGVFSIAAASRIRSLQCHGIELDSQAVEFASHNARLHDVASRCTFSAGDAGKRFARAAKRRPASETCILVDPPRTGLPESLLRQIGEYAPRRLIYVSCGPDTLRRDLIRLQKYGGRVISSGLLDMFPATPHFESLTVFSFDGKVPR